ncbi:trypsin Blo t 3-like isoform X2 [Cydia pomonella]|uniref:trypsin Blo t 3-like isoform X2 n=1 Tax=Cydia pomonella TaxID=82600 RepID=UPI002ADDB83D|nr:trypsin Blo t 3-like isoform X2 [Cydia pomonella]
MTMLSLYVLFFVLDKSNSGVLLSTTSAANATTKDFFGDTRRIIKGHEVFDTRPYMVYLRPTLTHSNVVDYNWLCGGVIIHENYILTSAACIEDIKYFWVVSGTHKWLPQSQTNTCIKNGALRAVWKCVHRTYRFDGNVFNNIRWMVNDIAVVMTEGPISFAKRVKGCDFIPQKIQYNNISKEYEEPGTKGFIAGWGSQDRYTDAADILARTSVNSPLLLEAETMIITKENCKHRWLARYHSIIDKYMICGKLARGGKMSDTCNENHVECRQLMFSEEVGPRVRRFEGNPDEFIQNSAAEVKKREQARKKTRRMNTRTAYGGFCENDHGGPLVVGRGKSSIVVGIMSTYKSRLCDRVKRRIQRARRGNI